MFWSYRTAGRALATGVGCLILIAAALPAAAGYEMRESVNSDRLELRNLIGEIEVVGHSGSEFEVEISVDGADADRGTVSVDRQGGSMMTIVFPESKSYVYPRLGKGDVNFDFDGESSWMGRLFGSGRRVKVSGSGSGLEVWADVTVHVPSGASLTIDHGVGNVAAADVSGELTLASRSGKVSVTNVDGELSVDTGSGSVSVERVVGGDILVDTGSGSVAMSDIEGGEISVDTGSGRVSIEQARARELMVDTGSGGVQASGIEADEASIDTGSGAVRLQLDRMGTGSFEIDTGSGGIELVLPTDASAEIRADTGSGGIDLDLVNAQVREKDRDSAVVIVGGGDTRVELDTGSGGIRITQ